MTFSAAVALLTMLSMNISDLNAEPFKVKDVP
jgi:hypothetical protein